MKPIIAVGIGNTTTKLGIVHSTQQWPATWSQVVEAETATFPPRPLNDRLPRPPADWYIATVHRQAEQRLSDWVRQRRPADRYHVCGQADLPLGVDVLAPERVGMDRLAGALAANRLRAASRSAIVVDAGTAITVDAVDAQGIFRGGAILPGLRIAARALADHTDLLPAVDCRFVEEPPLIGKSTEPAIRSGLFYGSIGSVRELIRRFAAELASPTETFITGGDAQLMAPHIDPTAHFISDLVLQGILVAATHMTHDQ